MSDWPDKKIQATALWYVRNHSMDPDTWRWTRLAEAHAETLALVELEPGELPVVSFFRSPESWYLFTTRRILGRYNEAKVEAAALDVTDSSFVGFKGCRGHETQVMILRLSGGAEFKLEYETVKASMGPIYYLRYWKIKYPVLHNLKDNPDA